MKKVDEKNKWIATGLPVKGNKKNAEALLLEARKDFISAIEPVQVQEDEDNILFADFMEQSGNVEESGRVNYTCSLYLWSQRTNCSLFLRKRDST
jgi:hypothetical protein